MNNRYGRLKGSMPLVTTMNVDIIMFAILCCITAAGLICGVHDIVNDIRDFKELKKNKNLSK